MLRRVLVGVCLAASLAFPGAATAATPFFVEPIQSGSLVGPGISIAPDSHGSPHVLYWDLTNTFLIYATRAGGSCSTPEDVDTGGANVGPYCAIAIDSEGRPSGFRSRPLASQSARTGCRTLRPSRAGS